MIAEWTQETASLFNQVSEWVGHQPGWRTEPEITYQDLPGNPENLENPGLKIITPKGQVHLEPIGRRADGRVIVEMYAWPTLVRVRLLPAPNSTDWQAVTDTGLSLRMRWNKQEFIQLIRDMQLLP